MALSCPVRQIKMLSFNNGSPGTPCLVDQGKGMVTIGTVRLKNDGNDILDKNAFYGKIHD
jgi:hypothetical protein